MERQREQPLTVDLSRYGDPSEAILFASRGLLVLVETSTIEVYTSDYEYRSDTGASV
jgi:hypothetical protein